MAKFIVFCADGTWNGPGEPNVDGSPESITNVLKAYRALGGSASAPDSDFALEQEKALRDGQGRTVQLAKYIDGVGDSSNPLVHAIGGDFGAGMIGRIVRGYTFVSRNYEPGDKIVLLGFSRGAYTARALGGLITGQGLLDRSRLDLGDKQHAYALGCAAWRAHRAATCGDEGFLEKIAEAVPVLEAFFESPPAADAYVSAPIEAIVVWDTVGSLGIPDLKNGVNLDLFRFVDTRLAPSVVRGFHAISADERRANFTPTLWDADPRVLQVLFPGAHADVGGGYTTADNESGLSDCALHCVLEQLRDIGVTVGPPEAPYRPDPAGVAHAPWREPPWDVLPSPVRDLPSGLSLARTVVDRLAMVAVLAYPKAAPGLYQPAALVRYLSGRVPLPGVPVHGC